MILTFGGDFVNFGGSLVGFGKPIQKKIWSLDVTSLSSYSNYPHEDGYNWHEGSLSSNGIKVTLEEPSSSVSTGYHYFDFILDSYLDLSEDVYIKIEFGETSSSPTLTMVLVDSNGNISNHLNLGKDENHTSNILITNSLSPKEDNNMGSLSSNGTLKSTRITNLLGNNIDKSTISRVRMCLANWYQTNPEWKTRSKSAVFKSLTLSNMEIV